MLHLTKGQTAENIVVTLTEKQTLTTGYFLFIFTHYTTKQKVYSIWNFLADDSTSTDRYNKFEIDTNAVFNNCPPGDWLYEVYEQASSSNTDPAGLTKLEDGILVLEPEIEFERTIYSQPQSFTVYGG